MQARRIAAIYAIIVGIGMVGVWAMLLITGQDAQLQEELQTIPFSIGMAIGSDVVTALALLTAAFALLKRRRWAVKALLFGMGFLFYSVINAAGLYGQRGDVPFTVMFAVIFVLGAVFTIFAFRENAAPID